MADAASRTCPRCGKIYTRAYSLKRHLAESKGGCRQAGAGAAAAESPQPQPQPPPQPAPMPPPLAPQKPQVLPQPSPGAPVLALYQAPAAAANAAVMPAPAPIMVVRPPAATPASPAPAVPPVVVAAPPATPATPATACTRCGKLFSNRSNMLRHQKNACPGALLAGPPAAAPPFYSTTLPPPAPPSPLLPPVPLPPMPASAVLVGFDRLHGWRMTAEHVNNAFSNNPILSRFLEKDCETQAVIESSGPVVTEMLIECLRQVHRSCPQLRNIYLNPKQTAQVYAFCDSGLWELRPLLDASRTLYDETIHGLFRIIASQQDDEPHAPQPQLSGEVKNAVGIINMLYKQNPEHFVKASRPAFAAYVSNLTQLASDSAAGRPGNNWRPPPAAVAPVEPPLPPIRYPPSAFDNPSHPLYHTRQYQRRQPLNDEITIEVDIVTTALQWASEAWTPLMVFDAVMRRAGGAPPETVLEDIYRKLQEALSEDPIPLLPDAAAAVRAAVDAYGKDPAGFRKQFYNRGTAAPRRPHPPPRIHAAAVTSSTGARATATEKR